MSVRKLCTSRWMVLLFLIATTSGPLAGLGQTIQPVQAPVVFGADTLFFISTRLGPYPPAERAKSISERLQRLASDPTAPLDSVVLSEGDGATDLVAGNIVLLSVTEADAVDAGRTRRELAEAMAEKIRAALSRAEAETDFKTVLLGLLFSVITTVVLGLLLFVLQKAFRKLYATLEAWRGARIRAIKFQKLEFLSDRQVTDILKFLFRLVRILLVLVLFYFYIPLVFSFFPWTRGFSAELFSYILRPLKVIGAGFLDYLPKLFFIAVVLVVTRFLLKFIRLIFLEIGRGRIRFPGFYPDWALPTYKIVRFLVIAFAAVVVFPYLPGANQPAFRGISIFLGVLFSFGSASAVANAIAGVVLTYMRPFKIGDRVRIADTMGDVTEKTILVTRVRTIKNVEITIPNAMVLGSHIINYSASARGLWLILHTTVTIGYNTPWRKVHELLVFSARDTRYILKEPAPFVLQTALDDSYVRYELNAYTDQPNQMQEIYSELHQNIQDRFNEAGVEIMSPAYHAVRDGNQSTIPEEHLPENYSAPGFRLFPLGSLFGKKGK